MINVEEINKLEMEKIYYLRYTTKFVNEFKHLKSLLEELETMSEREQKNNEGNWDFSNADVSREILFDGENEGGYKPNQNGKTFFEEVSLFRSMCIKKYFMHR